MNTSTTQSRRPGRRPVLTEADVEQIPARRAAGESFASIARSLGVHPTTVRLAHQGVTWQSRDPSQVDVPADMRRVPGFTAYLADEAGRIFSLRQSNEPREMTLGESGCGLKVFIVPDGETRGRTVQVHDLVCTAFHGPRPTADHRVLHRNQDRRDNHPENLQWASPAEFGPRPGGAPAGEAHGRSKLTARQVLEIRAHLLNHERPADVARAYGIHPNTVTGIAQGRLWAHLPDPDDGLPAVEPLPAAERGALRGEAHGRAKLSAEQVRVIRQRYTELPNRAEIAREFGVSSTTVARILAGTGWTHVE